MFDIIRRRIRGAATRARHGRGTRATVAVLSLLAIGACESDSVLDGPGGTPTGDPPTITNVGVPAAVVANDTLSLVIEAEAASGRIIDSMRVVLRTGSVIVRDTTVDANPRAASIAQTVRIPLPATLSGTQLVTNVTVYSGVTASSPQTTNIPITDVSRPAVSIIQPVHPDSTPAGDTTAVGSGATLRVAADVQDASGIAKVTFIGIARRGDPDLGTDVEVVRFEERVVDFPASGTDTLPTDTIIRRDLMQVGDTTESVLIIVTVTDLFGNVAADTVPVNVGGPDIQFLSPDPNNPGTVRVGTELRVRAQITDPAGLVSAELYISGNVLTDTVALPIAGLPDSTVLVYAIPPSQITQTGTITLSMRARNARGIVAPSAPVSVQVVDNSQPDANAPVVSMTIDPLPSLVAPLARVEQLDTITIEIEANDQGGVGVVQIGLIVDAFLNDAQDTAQLGYTINYATPTTNPDTTVRIAVRDLYADVSAALSRQVAWPDSINFRARAFAFDAQFNSDTVAVADGASGTRGYLLAVAGYTARLPGRGIISDAVIDTAAGSQRLFLSNFTQSRVDVLRLTDTTFVSGGILAGSQPWGMFIDNSGDTLLVANSGGTNLTKVPLRTGTLREDSTARIYTPDVALYELAAALDAALNPRYTGTAFGFSDRPQFLAQAATGQILYSTVPTSAAPDGTIRLAERQAGWQQHEVRLIYPGGDPADESAEDRVVVANIDSLSIVRFADGDSILMYDHVDGFPNSIVTGFGNPLEAVQELNTAGSDAALYAGAYSVEAVGLQDTTFVAASGDRQWIAFGEGATAPVGRIIMWNNAIGQSSSVQVVDLIDNAAERVTGIGLNLNGTLGVARGDFAAYYFTRDLRLQGLYAEDINPGGFGAALHPRHDTYRSSNINTLSFVGTAESTIKVIDTFHFFALGEMPIADPIVGPLRATLPLPGDNAGLSCPGNPQCVVVKLFGVTQSEGATRPDGVVILDVRENDLQ